MNNLALQERDNTIPHTIPQPQVTNSNKDICRKTLSKLFYNDFGSIFYHTHQKDNSYKPTIMMEDDRTCRDTIISCTKIWQARLWTVLTPWTQSLDNTPDSSSVTARSAVRARARKKSVIGTKPGSMVRWLPEKLFQKKFYH